MFTNHDKRLDLSYQCLLTVKAFKARPNFLKNTTEVLMKWLIDHKDHPWPNKQEKKRLCSESGLDYKQLRVWFTNNRKVRLRLIIYCFRES